MQHALKMRFWLLPTKSWKTKRVYNCVVALKDMRNDCPVGHLGQNRAFPVIYNII